jgi:hypothetical protein
MTRSALIGAAALTIALSAFAMPASAGGVTVTVNPQGESARMIQQGLQIYSIVQGFQNNKARVDQKGSNNAAAIQQGGTNNHGLVVQRGRGHMATVSQQGHGNALGVFQFGRKGNLHASQAGHGQVGLIFQGRW